MEYHYSSGSCRYTVLVLLCSEETSNLGQALKRNILIIILAGLVLSIILTIHADFKKPHKSSSAPLAVTPTETFTSKTVNPGLPVRLKIPKIKVDAPLDYIGLTPQGDLAAPKGPANGGWYDKGPRPGETGKAVIDGHYGYKDGIPAVFDNLHALQAGDTIDVVDEKGVTITFVVRELRKYTPNEDASTVFHATDGKAHLNLITCQGAWNQTQQGYSNRLVVFADRTP